MYQNLTAVAIICRALCQNTLVICHICGVNKTIMVVYRYENNKRTREFIVILFSTRIRSDIL